MDLRQRRVVPPSSVVDGVRMTYCSQSPLPCRSRQLLTGISRRDVDRPSRVVHSRVGAGGFACGSGDADVLAVLRDSAAVKSRARTLSPLPSTVAAVNWTERCR